MYKKCEINEEETYPFPYLLFFSILQIILKIFWRIKSYPSYFWSIYRKIMSMIIFTMYGKFDKFFIPYYLKKDIIQLFPIIGLFIIPHLH